MNTAFQEVCFSFVSLFTVLRSRVYISFRFLSTRFLRLGLPFTTPLRHCGLLSLVVLTYFIVFLFPSFRGTLSRFLQDVPFLYVIFQRVVFDLYRANPHSLNTPSKRGALLS